MTSSHEAIKAFKAITEQEKRFPDAHIYTNIKKFGVDLNSLAQNNPYLFQTFTQVFSGEATEETIILWDMIQKAYKELTEKGLLVFKNVRDDIMNKKMSELNAKVNGPNLVPLEKIVELLTEKKRKGVISVQVDFVEFMDLLEKYYEFQHRDFFSRFGVQQVDFAKMLGLTNNEYKKLCTMKVSKDLNAAKICVLTKMYENINGMPYVDFWHYLLDRDFCGISNGTVTNMYNYEEEDNKDFEKDGIMISGNLFKNMRKMIFKEIAQCPQYQGKMPNDIEFRICW